LAGLERAAARPYGLTMAARLHVLEARVVAAKHCALAIAARLKSDGLGQVAARICRLGTRSVAAATEGTLWAR